MALHGHGVAALNPKEEQPPVVLPPVVPSIPPPAPAQGVGGAVGDNNVSLQQQQRNEAVNQFGGSPQGPVAQGFQMQAGQTHPLFGGQGRDRQNYGPFNGGQIPEGAQTLRDQILPLIQQFRDGQMGHQDFAGMIRPLLQQLQQAFGNAQQASPQQRQEKMKRLHEFMQQQGQELQPIERLHRMRGRQQRRVRRLERGGAFQ